MTKIKNCAECWNMLSYCMWCGNWLKANEISQTLEEIKNESKTIYFLGRLLRFLFI